MGGAMTCKKCGAIIKNRGKNFAHHAVHQRSFDTEQPVQKGRDLRRLAIVGSCQYRNAGAPLLSSI